MLSAHRAYLQQNLPNIFGPPKKIYGQYPTNNLLHLVFILMSNKLHMDVYLIQWMERSQKIINLPNIFYKAVPAYEATEVKVLLHLYPIIIGTCRKIMCPGKAGK